MAGGGIHTCAGMYFTVIILASVFRLISALREDRMREAGTWTVMLFAGVAGMYAAWFLFA